MSNNHKEHEINADNEFTTERQLSNNDNKSEMDVVVEETPVVQFSVVAQADVQIEEPIFKNSNDVTMEEIVQDTPAVTSDEKSSEDPMQSQSNTFLANKQVSSPNETEKAVQEEDISMEVDAESEVFTEYEQKLSLHEFEVTEANKSEESPEMEVESSANDIEIVESNDEQIFTIKQDVLDFINIEEASADSVFDKSTKNNVNILLNHRKYVLKSITTQESTPFTSGILASQLNADYDISVNILKNGHIMFSNISDRHVLNLEYDLFDLFHISLAQLPYLTLSLKSHYSTNPLND